VGSELGREVADVTPRAKRKRQKDRALNDQRILEAARQTWMSGKERLQSYQHHDGVLVHRVVKDRRSFNVNAGQPAGNNDWVTRDVWATVCGRVLSVGRSTFLSSKRAPNCIYCVVTNSLRVGIGIDWASLTAPWDGKSKLVVS
jgi:hypothetical protein